MNHFHGFRDVFMDSVIVEEAAPRGDILGAEARPQASLSQTSLTERSGGFTEQGRSVGSAQVLE
jgi:hypothetical protein